MITSDIMRAPESVIDHLAADLHMVAQATGLADRARVVEVAHDLRVLLEWGFLVRVDIVLMDGAGAELHAATYRFTDRAAPWTGDRPGGNLWSCPQEGRLHIVISHSPAWWMLSTDERAAFIARNLRRIWAASDLDTSHPGLVAHSNRCYVSKGQVLERVGYRPI